MKKITFLLILFISTGVAFAQAPTDNATDPPARDAADVISIFSGAYTNVNVTNFDPNWGQSGHTQVNSSYDPGTGNVVLAYPNFNYQGTELDAQDASAMEFLHVDIWTNADPSATTIQVSPINNGTGAGEVLVTINHTQGGWYSVDIPKSSFTGMTWDSVFQLKFAANGAGSTVPVDIYLDNIYFWKNPADPNTDATLSNLEVDGMTIAGFNSNVEDYMYSVPAGDPVPTVTATTTEGAANAVVTQAGAVPGDATVVVTAGDGTTMKTYTVSFEEINAPSVAAPTPPARNASDVVSIYSDAYSDVTVDNWGPDWGPSSARINDFTVASNAAKVIDMNDGQTFAGIDFAGSSAFDASSFTHFHMDYYIAGSLLTGQTLSIKLSNHDGGAGETSAIQTIPTAVAGSWQSLDVPLDNFVAASAPDNFDRNAIAQIVISAARADNSMPVDIYIDNIYFHKNTVLSTRSEDLIESSVYPNPSSNDWNISTPNNIIQSVEIFNILGKKITNQRGNNSNDISISTQGIAAGVYIAKIKTDIGIKTVKLIRN